MSVLYVHDRNASTDRYAHLPPPGGGGSHRQGKQQQPPTLGRYMGVHESETCAHAGTGKHTNESHCDTMKEHTSKAAPGSTGPVGLRPAQQLCAAHTLPLPPYTCAAVPRPLLSSGFPSAYGCAFLSPSCPLAISNLPCPPLPGITSRASASQSQIGVAPSCTNRRQGQQQEPQPC